MSEQAPERRGGGILGMRPRTALLVLGGTAAAAVVWFWWRQRKAGQQQAAATSSTGCTDGSGNAVPCPDAAGVDLQGQLSVIQTELESLLSQEGQPSPADNDKRVQPGGGSGPPPSGTPAGRTGVPNVVGDDWGQAVNAIRRAGLRPVVRGAAAGARTNTHWRVTAQSPRAGTIVAKGSAVTVTVPRPSGARAGGGGGGGESENDSGSG